MRIFSPIISGSLQAQAVTGSFTGSFTGDGIGLYNIPASGITGLNLSQIASGSYSASISPANGFTVNTNTNISGALTASSAVISGNVIVQGTASINTLIVNQTQLSTGSNQLGDAVNDTQTLYGTVRIPTGSLTVTGSTFISSSNSTQLQVGNSALFVSSSGQVGIGTTTPAYSLDVQGNTNTDFGFQVLNSSAGTSARTFFQVVNNTGTYAELLLNSSTYSATTRFGQTGNVTYLDTNNKFVIGTIGGNDLILGTNNTERLRVFGSTGNISINTITDAGYKLDVSGSGRFSGNLTTTGSFTIQPTSSATQTVAIIQAGSGSIALIPSGSGAIMASVPDGTAVGGNARGTNSVDLQMSRSNSAQVAASPYSVIGGGSNNRINTFITNATICGGNQNQVTQNYSAVVGGNNNLAGGTFTFIGGGDSNNASSSNYSTISGGQSNTASTNTHATVVGGQGNTSSGQHSISGGRNSIASGNRSLAFNDGSQATGVGASAFNSSFAYGDYSTSFGTNSQAYTRTSFAIGNGSKALLYNSFSHGADSAYNGHYQYSNLVAIREAALTTAATSSLSLDGTGTTNLIIPNGNNRAWHTTVDTVAVVTAISGSATGVTVGDSFMQTDKLLFKRIGGTSSVVGRSTTETIYDTSMSTALMSFTAGSSQELAITFTAPTFSGGGSITCRVVSKVSLVEVAY